MRSNTEVVVRGEEGTSVGGSLTAGKGDSTAAK